MRPDLIVEGQRQPKPAPMAPLKLLPIAPVLFGIPTGEAQELTGEVGEVVMNWYAETVPMELDE